MLWPLALHLASEWASQPNDLHAEAQDILEQMGSKNSIMTTEKSTGNPVNVVDTITRYVEDTYKVQYPRYKQLEYIV